MQTPREVLCACATDSTLLKSNVTLNVTKLFNTRKIQCATNYLTELHI